MSRSYCFTHWDVAAPLEFDAATVRYASWQREKCPETGKEHFQGYMEFFRPHKLAGVKKWKGWGTAHLEVRKGDRDAAREYTRKQETRVDGPWEFGTWISGAGHRSDLTGAVATLVESKSLAKVARDHPNEYVKYYRGFAELQKKICPHVETPAFALSAFKHPAMDLALPVVLYGPSGTGKTEFAIAHFSHPLLVRHMDRLADFDAAVHDGIVFDDMAFTHIPVEARIHLLDTDRPSDIHIRYTTVWLPAGTKKIFTHNTGDVFTKTDEVIKEEQLAALLRRFVYVQIENKLF